MIIISIYGLDQFVVGRLSRELSENLADLYETSEENFIFISNEGTVFHQGVEQTSWDTYVFIKASRKYDIIEDIVAHFFLDQLSTYSINVHVEFIYDEGAHTHERINKEYPRFITEENIVNVGNEYDDEETEGDNEEEEIFDGDIFQDFNKNNE